MKPRQLLRRIRTIERVKKITKAMEVVASTQLRKLEQRYRRSKSFFEEFEKILSQLYFSYKSQTNKWFRFGDGYNYLLIVIGSDRGLCGAFNINLLSKIEELIAECERSGKKILEIIPVGKKCTSYCRRIYHKEGLINYAGKEEKFSEILTEKITASYLRRKVNNVLLVSNLYKKASGEKIQVEQILPLKFETQEGRRVDWILEPDWEALLDKIVPEYLKAKIFLRFIESRLAEELSRMLAMKYATENAEEMVEKLTLRYHRLRQSQITRELLDVIQAGKRV